MLLQPGLAGSDVEAHELVHVRQYEGAVLSIWLAAGLALFAFRFFGHSGLALPLVLALLVFVLPGTCCGLSWLGSMLASVFGSGF